MLVERSTSSNFSIRSWMFRISGAILLAVLLSASPAAGEGEVDWLYGASGESKVSSADNTVRSQPSIKRVGGALAIVLGGFFLLTLLLRKKSNSLPAHQMIEPLGSVPITSKVRLHLVRFGNRILVLNITGQNVQRVAELEDPDEVQKLLALSQGNSNSVSVSVTDLLQKMDSDSSVALRGQLG